MCEVFGGYIGRGYVLGVASAAILDVYDNNYMASTRGGGRFPTSIEYSGLGGKL